MDFSGGAAQSIDIEVAPSDVDWSSLHSLLISAFSYMADRIDPPSSLLSMSPVDLEEKAEAETLLTAATAEGRLVGCLFCRTEDRWLYVGKMAVAEGHQGAGIGRQLMARASEIARHRGLLGLELETRIELSENHEAFAKLGFVKVADQSHDGYSSVTNIRMRSSFAAQADAR